MKNEKTTKAEFLETGIATFPIANGVSLLVDCNDYQRGEDWSIKGRGVISGLKEGDAGTTLWIDKNVLSTNLQRKVGRAAGIDISTKNESIDTTYVNFSNPKTDRDEISKRLSDLYDAIDKVVLMCGGNLLLSNGRDGGGHGGGSRTGWQR